MTTENQVARDGVGARAFWYEGFQAGRLRSEALSPVAGGEARVRTLWSALSRGSERLVFNGLVPPEDFERMRAPMQAGAFPYPVKYGYCAVGVVEVGPRDWIGRTVFALHPHQDVFIAPLSMLHLVPGDLPPRRATLAANMETALNAVWDSEVGPGDRIAIVGAGLLGLLIAKVCSDLPGSDVWLVDRQLDRASLAFGFGSQFVLPDDVGELGAADVVFHASGDPAGLNLALRCAGDEAKIVDVSWYGTRAVPLELGGSFHSRRLQIVSSQVGSVPASRRARWSRDRRMAKAIELLGDARLDGLFGAETPFEELPARISDLLSPMAGGIVPLVRYKQA